MTIRQRSRFQTFRQFTFTGVSYTIWQRIELKFNVMHIKDVLCVLLFIPKKVVYNYI